MSKPPYKSGKSKLFSNADEAFNFVREIYEENCAYVRKAFEAYVQGDTPSGKVRACYPYVAMDLERQVFVDKRASYGFISEPGRYSTTLTRPDVFKNYLLQQFQLLLNNHKCQIEVGVSSTPIPIHFAFFDGTHLEGHLPVDRAALLRDYFDLPDIVNVDDSIANGQTSVCANGERPLSLFTAPRADYSLQRLRHYTGTCAEHFQSFVIFTNYQFYVDEFVRMGRAFIESAEDHGFYDMTVPYTELVLPQTRNAMGEAIPLPQMPAYHLKRADGRGITMINIGVGPSNARNISDHIAVLRPDAWIMLGHCAGLRRTQKLGDYVLAHGYVRDDHVLDTELPLWVPIPALAEVQRALEDAVAAVTGLDGYERKSVMRTGTVVSTDNRNWEISGYTKLVEAFCQSRAIALDMESAVIAANGFRFRVPYGTLLCVSDRPLHGEIKLPGMATNFYHRQVNQHLTIGLKALDFLRQNKSQRLHSRKLRSFTEVAFR